MNAKPNFVAWIETGRTNGLYTLHRRIVDRPVHHMVREYTYVRNLGRTWDVACANADKYIDENVNCTYVKDYDLSDECGTLRKAGEYDDNRFWFGKYETRMIDEIVVEDVEYIKYLRDNFDRGTGNARMDSLLRSFDELELGLSEYAQKQAKWTEEREQRIEEDKKNAKPIPTELNEGRHTFRGEILVTKWQASDYGDQLKMLVAEERGFKVWGTAPNALWNDHEGSVKGMTVQFDATLTISEKDECFGFYKRPTKVSVVSIPEEES